MNGSEPNITDRSHPLPVQPGAPLEDEIDLLDYVEVIVRRRWLIFWAVLVCMVAALAYAKDSPILFQAEAIILPSEERDYLRLGTERQVTRRSYQLDILRSTPVSRKVLQKVYQYTLDGKPYATTLLAFFRAQTLQEGMKALQGLAKFGFGPSGVITISAETASPELSAGIANAYVEGLKAYNQEKQTEHMQARLKFIEGRMKELQDSLGVAEEALVSFQNRNHYLSVEGGAAFLSPEQVVEYSRLKRSVETLSSLLETVSNQYEIARVEEKKVVTGIEVLNEAETPELGSGLGKRKAVMTSAAVGLFVSVFLAFLLEYIERNRRSGRLDLIVQELQGDVDWVRRLLRMKN